MDLLGSTHRPHRFVLVSRGDAKKRQYLIAHELIDAPPVALHDRHRFGFDAAHEALDLLWVEFLVHGRVTGKVGEEDGRLAAFAFGSCGGMGGVRC